MSLEANSFIQCIVDRSARGVRLASPRRLNHAKMPCRPLATALSIVSAEAADKPTLTVYTYESFVGEYGPGQALKKAFEAKCGCELAFVSAEDGGALYAKLKLEGSATKADVLLGIDDNLMGEAEASGLIAPHGLEAQKLDLPEPWSQRTSCPMTGVTSPSSMIRTS